MATCFPLRTVLTTRLARFMATAIIVLSVSPFTAPFTTFDAAEHTFEQALHAGAAQLKLVQDAADFGLITPTAVPLTFDVALDRTSFVDRIECRPLRVLVLRI